MKMQANRKTVFVFATVIVLFTVRSGAREISGRQPEQPETIPTIPKEVKPVVPSDTGGGGPGDSLDLERWRSQEAAAPPQESEHQQLSIHTERNQLDAGSTRVQPAGNPDYCIVDMLQLESIPEPPQSTSTQVVETSYQEEGMHVASVAHGGTSTRRWVRPFYCYVEGETSSEAGTSRIHSGNRRIVTGGAGTGEIREQGQLRFRAEENLRLNHNISPTQLAQMTERLRFPENPLESTNQPSSVNMLRGTSGGAQITLTSLHRRQITMLRNSQDLEGGTPSPDDAGVNLPDNSQDLVGGTPSQDGTGVNRQRNRAFGLLLAGCQLGGARRTDFTRERLWPISCYIAFAVAILMISLFLLWGKPLPDPQHNAMVAVAVLLLFMEWFVIKPLYLP